MGAGPRVENDPRVTRQVCDEARAAGKRVALVPTMGALHDGHLTLVEAATGEADFSVVSIFVNPKQFGPGEDFERYPRTLDTDLAKLAPLGVDLVFAPNGATMYAEGFATLVRVEELTSCLCGAHRPGHFDGVTTVVNKLFNIVGPCQAFFGRKDYQQLQVIKRMTRDLNLPVDVRGLPTHREPDGLAMSSRNAYLGPAERERALALYQGLEAAAKLFAGGERRVGPLRRAVLAPVAAAADRVDYVTAADPDELNEIPDDAIAGQRLLIAIAARRGNTRLIDNTVLGEDRLAQRQPD